MGNFLVAKLNLAIKAIYTEIKKKLPGKLIPGKSLVNKKSATAYLLRWVPKAYREGIDYAVIDVRQRLSVNIKPRYKIDSRERDKLLGEFLKRMDAASKVYAARIDGYKRIKKNQPGITKRSSPREQQFFEEFQNAVNKAANNLLLRAASLGQRVVYEEAEKVEA